MSNTRWFQLRDHIGVTADGNPEPLVEQSLTMAVPAMRGRELVEDSFGIVIQPSGALKETEHARIVPFTRIIEVADPRVADVLMQTGHYDEIDPPTKRDQQAAKKALTDAVEEAGTHEPDPETSPEQYEEGHAGDESKGA
jgi:hypothetical protein